ncbi:hypothetical protein Rhopal_000581-T1 [Rhodotorula paludigena]|uniref:Solute carrier family 40 protein n=1 Tax=Rhodotorula paludigena TaxID=86838 RepID=A0AAV5GDE3_9BASI|nr:hypothetical protein Rhopal_000581-T1 [Rhodotorula paludigena]
MSSAEAHTAALRPLTLPSLSPQLALVSTLKTQLATLHADRERHRQLETKLDTFTDEPTWNAFIPLGPLAYFPGQLVHTNDITQTVQDGDGQPKHVLRSAKQARREVQRLTSELDTRIASLEAEIRDKEAELRHQREQERSKGKGAAGPGAGEMGDEDWTINANGEVINEEGLPMFDIREDLPSEPQPSASSKAARDADPTKGAAPKMRYLIKKGGKQVVGSTHASPAPKIAPSAPTSATATRPKPSAPDSQPSPFADRPKLDIKAILDELEAEEAAAAPSSIDAAPADEPSSAPSPAALGAAPAAPKPSAPPASTSSASPAFAGFSAGFLSKSKQKRPSNSLPPAPSTAAPSVANAGGGSAADAVPPQQPLKSSLSRAPSQGGKKRVAFDLPAAGHAADGGTAGAVEGGAREKKTPIILGMGEGGEALSAEQEGEKGKGKGKEPEQPFVRPIRETVVERPMRKAVPPGGAGGAAAAAGGGLPVREKRMSRFRRDLGAAEERSEPEAQGSTAPPPPVSAAGPPSVRAAPAAQEEQGSMPAPVHTISLSGSSSAAGKAGTVSYADIPFDSGDEDPEGADDDDDEDDDGGFRDWDEDDEEFDDEDFDVDAAMMQREVALAYHRQRMNLGAGRGTGALGGYHQEGESPFAHTGLDVDTQSLVPSDATLQSLSPDAASSTFGTYADAGAAQQGKPSRFRLANRNLEQAQLIIPSLLAADPALSMSHVPLGPAAEGGGGGGADDGLDADERERLRRTLEALAEGKPLPADEQAAERAREVALREELRREKDEEERVRRERTAGKRPPELAPAIPVVRDAVKEKVPEASTSVAPVSEAAAVGTSEAPGEAVPPKRMSSTWQQRSFEFGAYLFLVNLFPDTTLQPSIYGFFTTGAAILLSGSVGSLVDHYARIPFVRATVVVQKGTLACSYAVFLACFLRLHTVAQEGREQPILTVLFVIVIGMSVAVERDWVTCIAQGDGAQLTTLNTPLEPVTRRTPFAHLPARIRLRIITEGRNWLDFIRAPVFFSSLAISLLYLTVLSFEGSMLAYLKSHDYDDSFVAGMRGVGVVTGLLGTLLMPFLEPRIGLVRTGTWSIL